MADIVDNVTRSKMMSKIRGKNTRLELSIRKELFRQGFRYRLHDTRLPGKPDLVLPKYHCVIFLNGCFWHGHDCGLYREPKSNTYFWSSKITKNRKNDAMVQQALLDLGWRVLTVWECAVRIRRLQAAEVASQISAWLASEDQLGEIRC